MARLSDAQWQVIRAEYESSDSTSLRDLAKKHGVDVSNLSRRSKKEGWTQGKTQHLVDKKVNAIKALHETTQQTQHLNATEQMAIDVRVNEALEAEKIFINSAKYNQELANSLLGSAGELSMQVIESHSRLTARNKETVLGKQPDTQVNVQNNMPQQITRVIVDPAHD